MRARPRLRTVTFGDDIFGPSQPWLAEFCRRYKEEIGLPFVIYSFPRSRFLQPSGRSRPDLKADPGETVANAPSQGDGEYFRPCRSA